MPAETPEQQQPALPGGLPFLVRPCLTGPPSTGTSSSRATRRKATAESAICSGNNVPGPCMMKEIRGADLPRLSHVPGAVMNQEQPGAPEPSPFPQASNPSRPTPKANPSSSRDRSSPRADTPGHASAEQSQRDSRGRFTAGNKGGPANLPSMTSKDQRCHLYRLRRHQTDWLSVEESRDRPKKSKA